MRKNHAMRQATQMLPILIATFFLTSEPFPQTEATVNSYSLNHEMIREALDKGRTHSDRVTDALEMQGERERLERALRCGQILVAEGDSWFNYPLKSDVLKRLRKLGWAIYSSAQHGDTMEGMLYDVGQLESLYRHLLFISITEPSGGTDYSHNECLVPKPNGAPKAIILSMGGNDLVGNALLFLLEHRRSSLYNENDSSNINQDIRNGFFRRITVMLIEYISTVMNLCQDIYSICDQIPILIHGYDYPQHTGKGYRILGINVAGPWIEPALAAKERLAEETDENREAEPSPDPAISQLVNEYNEILCNVADYFSEAAAPQPVYFLDFREAIREVGNWRDELHPNKQAAIGLARIISKVIQEFHVGEGLSNDQHCIDGLEIFQGVQ